MAGVIALVAINPGPRIPNDSIFAIPENLSLAFSNYSLVNNDVGLQIWQVGNFNDMLYTVA
jgi:hypothetical protein